MKRNKDELTPEQLELIETFDKLDKVGKNMLQIKIYQELDRMSKRPRPDESLYNTKIIL